jgi:ribosomal protein S18 acetylase RimI-like enzyme
VSTRLDSATLADLPQLVELLGLLLAQEAEFAPDPAKQRRALETMLGEPDRARIFVAREEPGVIGMCALHFTTSTAEGGKAAWFEDLVVSPECRGRGVGTSLLRHAIEAARAAGVLRLTLLTDAANERAQALYRRLGFSASPMRPMRRKL